MSVPTTPSGVPVPRRVVVILLLVIPLSQIPLDIYTPALPQMVLDLDASAAVVQNTVTAYMLGMSLAFIPVGLIADALGRKRTLVTCLAILVVTSVGCALVQNITLLLGLRFVQGIGGCACLVLAYAIAADCYRGARLTSVSGLLGAAWGLAPVLAPAVGGVLVQFISWRLVFGLIAFLAALAVPLVVAGLPETLPPELRASVDVGAAARVLGAALRHRIFVGFVLVFGLMASAQMVFGVVAPFLYQQILGFSPAAYGAVALVVGGANLLGELACSALAVRVGTRRLAFGAWWVFVSGALVLTVTAGLSVVTVPAITIGAPRARRMRGAVPADVRAGPRTVHPQSRTDRRCRHGGLLSRRQCGDGRGRSAAGEQPGTAGLAVPDLGAGARDLLLALDHVHPAVRRVPLRRTRTTTRTEVTSRAAFTPGAALPRPRVSVIFQRRIDDASYADYARWQKRAAEALATVPGFIDQDIVPPSPPVQDDWVDVLRFATIEDARAWLDSGLRTELVAEIKHAFIGNEDVHLLTGEQTREQSATSVVISCHVDPEDESAFMDWQRKISAAEAGFRGFRGHKVGGRCRNHRGLDDRAELRHRGQPGGVDGFTRAGRPLEGG